VRAALILLAVVAAVAINVMLLGYAAQPKDPFGRLTPAATLPVAPAPSDPAVRPNDGEDD
jgi:hypothetical protein